MPSVTLSMSAISRARRKAVGNHRFCRHPLCAAFKVEEGRACGFELSLHLGAETLAPLSVRRHSRHGRHKQCSDQTKTTVWILELTSSIRLGLNSLCAQIVIRSTSLTVTFSVSPAPTLTRLDTQPERGGLGRLRSAVKSPSCRSSSWQARGEIFRVIRARFVGAVASPISCVGRVV